MMKGMRAVQRCWWVAWLTVLAVVFADTGRAQTNLVKNGSFEGQELTATSIFAYWQGGASAIVSEPSTAADGADCAVLGGSISQDIVTVPGHRYRLRFASAGNDPGESYSPLLVLWWTNIVTEITNLLTAVSGVPHSPPVWTYNTFDLTAQRTITTLCFTTEKAGWGWQYLDDVSLVALPDPPLWNWTNSPPAISDIRNQVGTEGTTVVFDFSISDTDVDANFLTVTATSSNPSLMPDANLHFVGRADRKVANFQPLPGQDGTTTIAITVSDGELQTTEAVEVRILPPLPSVTGSPADQIVQPGEAATFSVGIDRPQIENVQWLFNGVPIPGATEPVLTLTNISDSMAGCYSVRVSSDGGSVTSPMAVLDVLEPGGTVYFVNRVVPEMDAPVYGADGVTLLSDDAFLAQMYAGTASGDLAPVGPAVPFGYGLANGYWRTRPDPVRSIPWVNPGDVALVQARVWQAGTGTTWEAARAAGGLVGMSAILQLRTGGGGMPPSLPAFLIGLSSFHLVQVGATEEAGAAAARALGQSTSALAIATDRTGKARLRVVGPFAQGWEIQSSNDLLSWVPIVRVENLGGEAECVFLSAVDSPARFFRAAGLNRETITLGRTPVNAANASWSRLTPTYLNNSAVIAPDRTNP